MKLLLFIFSACIMLAASACRKCSCNSAWDDNTLYVKGNSVSYNGNCYKAVAQGSGIVPGPWMQNGNDIWKLCTAE